MIFSSFSSKNKMSDGDCVYDKETNRFLMFISGTWLDVYKIYKNNALKRVSNQCFTCRTLSFSVFIDDRIKELGLKSIKKCRQFDKTLYIIENDADIGAFILHFSEFFDYT